MHRIWTIILILTIGASIAGCGQEENIPVSTPKGWYGNSTIWWQVGADTTNAYRALETMEDMGVPGSFLLSLTIDGTSDTEMELAQRKFNQYLKESLIELFRNEPELVDSLFEKYVVPKISGINLEGDVQPLIKEYKGVAYQILIRHFRYPISITKLGLEIPIQVPDSLKGKGISGAVFLQIALNKEGVPKAIKKLDGLHPTLDRIAMRAMTQMRWKPAYILKNGQFRPTPSWARMRVLFGAEK